jgi:hypothetical protein
VISDQRIEERGDQPYAGIRTEVSMDVFGEILGPMWGEVFAWIGPAGPYRLRD